jgi:hypothetical protein
MVSGGDEKRCIMAIVKATYTRRSEGAKASIRYIENRPGKENEKITRSLFGSDGKMERMEAYSMIDDAEKGSIFFRFVISPDPEKEDTQKDLQLREITERTMQQLEKQIKKTVQWVAAIHNDHAPHRHVHVVAVIKGRLNSQDFYQMRKEATEASVDQRRELDLMREQMQVREQGEQWERQR